MTREQLQEKSLNDLREIAKLQGVKSLTKYRKGELIDIIRDTYGKELTDAEEKELSKINTHDDKLTVSPELLEHLAELNKVALDKTLANL